MPTLSNRTIVGTKTSELELHAGRWGAEWRSFLNQKNIKGVSYGTVEVSEDEFVFNEEIEREVLRMGGVEWLEHERDTATPSEHLGILEIVSLVRRRIVDIEREMVSHLV